MVKTRYGERDGVVRKTDKRTEEEKVKSETDRHTDRQTEGTGELGGGGGERSRQAEKERE